MAALTKREQQCVEWMANGKTAWETARILSISEATVVFHIENAKKKLGATTLAHAVAIAVSQRMVNVPVARGRDPTGRVCTGEDKVEC